jgi:hypothetical protein
MSQSQKIIKIIEGFKLGNLGAGKPRFTEEPEFPLEDDSQVENIKWYRKTKKSRKEWLGGVSWSETSEISQWENNFFMIFDMSDDHEYYRLGIYGGGVYLRIQNNGFDMSAQHHSFEIDLDFKAPDDESATKIMKQTMGRIKEAGSFGKALMSGAIGSGWSVYYEEGSYFQDYLLRKSGKNKSPHFGKA